ncbi:hypothetical protein LIER_18134 [Lithospermum erythrorhizon]
MKNKYGGNDKVKRSLCNTYRREFKVLEMKKGDSIDEYFSRVLMVANKLKSNGEEVFDTKIVEKIMRILSEQYTYIMVAIEESKDIITMTLDDLKSSLNTHAHKLMRKNKTEKD